MVLLFRLGTTAPWGAANRAILELVTKTGASGGSKGPAKPFEVGDMGCRGARRRGAGCWSALVGGSGRYQARALARTLHYRVRARQADEMGRCAVDLRGIRGPPPAPRHHIQR